LDERNVTVQVDGETIDTGQDKLGAIIGKKCKTGINTSIMPGVRIGEGSFVGPHVCLMSDLEPGKMILDKPNYHIVPNNIAVAEEKKEQFSRRLLGGQPCAE
jgi:bifunctional UDP-N-acetylglucosamine pyrophosphorylase/glucosamine-1-phosphate N-acetyltransferase